MISIKNETEIETDKTDYNNKILHNTNGVYDIEFDSVSLKIGEKTIIDDFSFKFETNKKYLVVGVNGSGKSSVFKILKKWYNNCSGNIFINEIPISSYSNRELSRIVSYLNENVSIFSGSIMSFSFTPIFTP